MSKRTSGKETKMQTQRQQLLSDGVHSHQAGGYLVVLDGRAVMHGAVVARFSSRDEALRFYAAASQS